VIISSPLLNVPQAGDVLQNGMHTAEPFVPDPSTIDVELATGNFKRNNLQVLIRS
jgi:hypothetical protein